MPKTGHRSKTTKNRVTKSIRQSKEDYFKTQVSENRNNPKKIWKLIKNLTKEYPNNHSLINPLVDKDGNQYSDHQQMADLINTFYACQPRDLLESISPSLPDSSPYKTDATCSTSNIAPLSIPHIFESEIESAIRSMPVHKATGADGLSIRILKISAPAISSSLARIINYCIDNSCVPSARKLAKVIPIYKVTGSKSNTSNYGPISVLPLLSKIFERHIHTSLYNHLKDNNLLYNLQSGFRKTYSTETALIQTNYFGTSTTIKLMDWCSSITKKRLILSTTTFYCQS